MLLVLAHITLHDVGFGTALFLAGVLAGALAVARFQRSARRR
jgi:hypothetical protein